MRVDFLSLRYTYAIVNINIKATKMQTFKFTTTKHTYTIPLKYKHLSTVSSIIRAMKKDNYTTAQISNLTSIRYQHVRNVLITPLNS